MKKVVLSVFAVLFFLTSVTPAQDARKLVLESGGANVSPELVVQDWHNGDIDYVEYSKDGKYILTAKKRDCIKIWDEKTGLLLRTFFIRYDGCVKFFPDGKSFVYTDCFPASVRRVDILSGSESVLGDIKSCNISFSMDGKYLGSVNGNSVSIYDAMTLEHCFDTSKFSFAGRSIVISDSADLIFSRNSKFIAVASRSICNVWNVRSGRTEVSFRCDSDIVSLDFDENEKYILCRKEKGFEIYEIKTSKVIFSVDSEEYIKDAKFIPSSQKVLAFYSGGDCSYWNYKTKQKSGDMKIGEHIGIQSISFSGNRKKFVVAYGKTWYPDCLDIVDVESWEVLKKIKQASDTNTLVYNPKTDSMYLYSHTKNNLICMTSNFAEKELPPDVKKIEFSNFAIFDDGFIYIDKKNNILNKYDENKHKIEEVMPVSKISHRTPLSSSSDGSVVAYIDGSGDLQICNTLKNERVEFSAGYTSDVRVSPDAKFVVFSNGTFNAPVSNIVATDKNEVIKTISIDSISQPGDFSFDSNFYAVRNTQTIDIYSTKNWKKIYEIDGDIHFCFSHDGKYIAVESFDDGGKIKVYSFPSLKLEREFKKNVFGHAFFLNFDASKSFSMDFGGKIDCFSTKNGELLANAVADSFGDYVVYTPEGYFAGSPGGIDKFVHLVNGMEVSELGQYAETLFRPDLVAAKIRGESVAESENAVLAELVTSGEPPLVSFSELPPVSSSRDITVDFSVQDAGGGIGNVYVSVNGKVKQIADGSRSFELVGGNAAQSSKKKNGTVSYSPTISLSSGVNTIEAFATNKSGKVESRRAIARISWKGAENKPNLHVLAVGVNEYSARGVSKLNYAVPDVESIASSFSSAGKSLYGSVSVVALTDEKASSSGIVAEFNRLSNIVKSDDVFVFYVSGHGTSYNGDYYFIPVDFDGNLSTAVSKTFIMNNMQKIAAQKSLLILDTCYSGAIVNESDTTAYQRLARATGQAIIAASSDAQTAIEGYEGHGVFTYALLEGLSGKAGSPDDKSISLLDLAAYVSKTVPKLSEQKWNYSQMPWFDIRKQDFPLVGK